MKKIILAILLSGIVANAFTQTKQELIRELFRLMKQDSIASKTIESTLPATFEIIKRTTKDSTSRASKAIETSTKQMALRYTNMFYKVINEDLIAIYDKYFSETEIKNLITFYQSPIGQKLVATQPAINKDLAEVIIKKYLPIISDSIYKDIVKAPSRKARTPKSKRIIELDTVFSADSIETTSNDMQKYMSTTQWLVDQGKYKLALARTIWFHEHALERQPSMSGVKLSFALSDWAKLGEVYPPAITALKEIRDKDVKRFEQNYASSKLFSEIEAINTHLKEEQKTVELFEILMKENPEAAKSVWTYAEDLMFKVKRYDIVKNFIGNPMRNYSKIEENYYRDTSMFHKGGYTNALIKSIHEDNFVEKCLKLIDFSLYINDKKSAKAIQQKALAIVDDNRLKDAIKHRRWYSIF